MNYKSQFSLDDSYYFNKLDFISWNRYYHVIKSFKNLKSEKVLEIGSGDGIIKSILEPHVKLYLTLDINEKMHPDFVSDVRDIIPELIGKFDLIIITDVLEHIELNTLHIALNNIFSYGQSGSNVIVTIPFRRTFFTFFSSLNYEPKFISIVNGFGSFKSFYRNFILKKPWIDPHHCYEIGVGNVSLSSINHIFKSVGFKIKTCKKIPYVNFWVLEK